MSNGRPVDAQGLPATDPTKNVIDILDAAVDRQDDLRTAETRLLDAQIAHTNESARLRAEYDDKLRDAESKRIDAIRAVDVAAVASAAAVVAQQQNILATQVATSADALRLQVAATALAAETKLNTALEPIQKDIRDLRDRMQTDVGLKSAAYDPVLKAIADLRESQTTSRVHDT